MNKFNLRNHPKISNGFKAPEHYFENFSDAVLEKMTKGQPKKRKIFTLKNIAYAVAAVLVLALTIPFLNSTQKLSLEQIDTDTLENYITYQSNVSQYDLLNLMDAHQIESMRIKINLEDESIENILTTNSNFELYIID